MVCQYHLTHQSETVLLRSSHSTPLDLIFDSLTSCKQLNEEILHLLHIDSHTPCSDAKHLETKEQRKHTLF